MSGTLTHFDEQGAARMVDLGGKADAAREAEAEARVTMQAATLARLAAGTLEKGDVLGIARLAGIGGAKHTALLIPLCHPVRLTAVELDFQLEEDPPTVVVRARVRCVDRTGPEMEALTAAATAALTVYDMCKAVDRGMVVEQVRLLRKSGGKSGVWTRT